jgi:hypothetical protein
MHKWIEELHILFKFALATAWIWHSFYLENLRFAVGFKVTACVALVRKAADDIRITISFQILRIKENKWTCSN